MTAGSGGNRQKGISYGASATEVLLLSDPGTHAELGIPRYLARERSLPLLRRVERLPGDMTFTGGNQAILDRVSRPEIHLFTKTSGRAPISGTLCVRRVDYVPASRDGRPWQAIVFRLVRTCRDSRSTFNPLSNRSSSVSPVDCFRPVSVISRTTLSMSGWFGS